MMSIPSQKGAPLCPEHYFCTNAKQYVVKNSYFWCLKELSHMVRLFHKFIYLVSVIANSKQ